MVLKEIIGNLLELDLNREVRIVEGKMEIAELFDILGTATADELDMKVRNYKALLDRKDNLKILTSDNNKEAEAAEQDIAQLMIDSEKPSTVVDGFTYSLQQKTMYAKKSEEALAEAGIVFFDVLREQGLGDIIVERVDPRTLQSTVKTIADEGEIPEELAECLSIYEKLGISKRKANTKALERAKKNREE